LSFNLAEEMGERAMVMGYLERAHAVLNYSGIINTKI
jgi:hypothetical protein